ncbi:MAG: SGNH/GDSL hydrolase family protein [Treponema sp.]|jgi:lysophospholipase L1-like esterase|nr:SGNH/GDSL hydrolase family protein [Treponema sp.]
MKNIIDGNSIILFQGDSITDCERAKEAAAGSSDPFVPADLGSGYPAKIAGIFEILFPGSGARFVNRGISGNRVKDLLERYEKDFISLKPDVVSILIGINDTWRRYDSNDPTGVELFESQYRTLLKKLKHDLPQTSVIIIEPFLLNSIPGRNVWREDLDPKIQVVRSLAREFADCYLPMDGIFARCAVEGVKETDMAADGVHPTPLGHGIMAKEWLKALDII